MAAIVRKPESAGRDIFDVIVIGGGIYGACLLLEAAARGLRALLLEQSDFGGGTSFNSLRIIHGGLRYLQQLDLHRFLESVSERRWFLRNFPDLVIPMPCLMPLYGDGLRRPEILSAALRANDILSRNRNRGVARERVIPNGSVVNNLRTRDIFPQVDGQGLKAGAIWYDAFMPDSSRLLMEVLRWACDYGATALNYVKALRLLTTRGSGKVVGVLAQDMETNRSHEFRGDIVVNACGPGSRSVAKDFDRDIPELFRSSIAWNVLFDRPALSDHALAVAPRRPGARTYFLLPWHGKLFAGTGHDAWREPDGAPRPSPDQLDRFMTDLNEAVKGLDLSKDVIIHVFSGLLPAKRNGEDQLAVREVIVNHVDHGGPDGLYSISGVKFTTARLVAEKTLNQAFGKPKEPKSTTNRCIGGFLPTISVGNDAGDMSPDPFDCRLGAGFRSRIRSTIEEESPQHLEDVIFRRTGLWFHIGDNPVLLSVIADCFQWDNDRLAEELDSFKRNHPSLLP